MKNYRPYRSLGAIIQEIYKTDKSQNKYVYDIYTMLEVKDK